MVCCCTVMVEFMWRTRSLPKLDTPHEMPTPAMYGAVILTVGIVLGYSYNMIFNYAFSDCDKLVDVIYGSEYWLDVFYSSLMITFCIISLLYVLHRSYYGAINTHLDKVTRLWVNLTITIVWMKVVIYKGYLSHQELCKRKELEGYWCPSIKRYYNCDPYTDLAGMQIIWYYINKGLLSSAVISCASEFFPVLLVAHWLSCGGAEEKAEDLLKRRQMKQGFRSLLKEFMKDISRVYAENPALKAPRLRPSRNLKVWLNFIVVFATIATIVRWFIFFYYTIDFDHLISIDWMTNEYAMIGSNFLLVVMFISIYIWSRRLSNDRLDAHHKAEARGDIIILFGCVIVLTVKYILQIIELAYQHQDHFITLEHCILHSVSLTFMEISQWLQYFCVRRLLALNDRDCRSTKHFLPTIALGGFISGWIHFGITFLDTMTIKYQLTDETFKFSEVTLISMIFTQTLFPADYLYAFTVSCSWSELILRYKEMGTFQLGAPRLVSSEMVKKLLEGEDSPTFIHRAFHYARARALTRHSTDSTEPVEERKNTSEERNEGIQRSSIEDNLEADQDPKWSTSL
ncbi:hypothetical protein FO519_003625 [Halicephalobus sp. NKZ332]|nr:hypothetical protein FO519_003625 [Halicephalobus sp. NKZ332]